MPHKNNSYISSQAVTELAQKGAYFQRNHNKTGGYFIVNGTTWKINEKTFKTIQPYLKPRL